MKKEYIKPLMDSEMFIANEYIATCWDVRCLYKDINLSTCKYNDEEYLKNHHINGLNLKEALSKDYDFMHIGIVSEYHKVQISTFQFTEEDPSKYYHETGVPTVHHEVYFVENPNAS